MYSMKRSEEMPSTNESWSYPVAQMLLFGEPRYLVGVNAPSAGSNEPVSSRPRWRGEGWKKSTFVSRAVRCEPVNTKIGRAHV